MTRYRNNFDLLRLLGAILVIISHSFGVLGKGNSQPMLHIGNMRLLPSDIGLFVFFTISGYLVFQSLEHSSTAWHYCKKRILRIYPALIACNIVCILVIGLFFGRIPFFTYLSLPETWSYLWYNTILYKNQFYLPGIFETLRPANEINSSLWTLSVEVCLYAMLLFLGVAGCIKTRLKFTITVCLLIVICAVIRNMSLWGWELWPYINLSIYFVAGMILYFFRNQIRWKWYWPVILLVLFFIIGQPAFHWILITALISYCVIWAGNAKQIVSLRGNDISYGMYVYAFPVQQCILVISGKEINAWVHILLTLFITVPLAFLSWKLIEKPALSLKSK